MHHPGPVVGGCTFRSTRCSQRCPVTGPASGVFLALPCLQVHVPRGAANSKKVEENVRSLEEEVQLLQQFDHPNIVRYLVRVPARRGAWPG